jgi:WD40 repeat protein
MDFGRDDTLFAQGYDGGRVQLFDTGTGQELARSRPLETMVTDLRFSADGRHLVAVDDGGRLVRLDAVTLARAGPLTTVPEKPYSVTVSPDGAQAFVAAGGTRWRPYWDVPMDHFYVVDLSSGEVVQQGDVGVRSATYAVWSPTGDRVAVSGENGDVAVIDLVTGRAVRRAVTGHDGNVYGLAFDDTGTRVVTASDARDLALWDASTGTLLATSVIPSTEGVPLVGFRPDGSVLVVTFDGDFYRWDPSLTNAVEAACRMAGRDLTQDEWEAAFPDQPWKATCS